VYVGTVGLAPIDRLRSAASATSLTALLVDDGTGAEAAATQLRSAGALVAVIDAGGVQTWFNSGCIAS
jgi:hypothetical protein